MMNSMMFSNVIVDITFPRGPIVFSQSCCEVPTSLHDTEALDLINRSLSVYKFVLVFDVCW